MVPFSHLGLARIAVLFLGLVSLLFGTHSSPKIAHKGITPTISPAISPKEHISPTSPMGSSSSSRASSLLSDFVYPGAQTIQNSGGTITLQTTDQPTAITDWYKNQLSSHAFTTTTVIQTNTNDTIENKLVGSKDAMTIAIAISKNPSDDTTKIEVSNQ